MEATNTIKAIQNNPPTQSTSQPQLPTTKSQPDQLTIHKSSSTPQQQQSLITDFSSMFKRKSSFTANNKKSNKTKINQNINKTPNWLLQIPAKLQITLQDLQARRYMNNNKWMNVIKSNEQWKKIIVAVCSCWNYLSSEKGIGKEKVMNANEILQIISKSISLQQLRQVNQFERYALLVKIFNILNKQFNKKFQLSIICKLACPNKLQPSSNAQKQQLLISLKSPNKSHIYLTHEEILLPIGYQKTPLKHLQAYQKIENIAQQNQQLWIITSALGRNQPSFCIKRWSDIQKDLETIWPNYFDIKQVKQGVRIRNDANQQNMNQDRGTSNCIIEITLNQ